MLTNIAETVRRETCHQGKEVKRCDSIKSMRSCAFRKGEFDRKESSLRPKKEQRGEGVKKRNCEVQPNSAILKEVTTLRISHQRKTQKKNNTNEGGRKNRDGRSNAFVGKKSRKIKKAFKKKKE